jgi:hypothetical protein
VLGMFGKSPVLVGMRVVVGFSVFLAMVPVVISGSEDVRVPSEDNISAVVSKIWTSFPRVQGSGGIALRAPFDMCVDSKGRMFILDRGQEGLVSVRIVVLNREMEVEDVIGSTDDVTVRVPEFRESGVFLTDIAVDSKDRIYVCDASFTEHPGGPPVPGRVHILHSNLSWLGYIEVPNDGFAAYPYCITMDQEDRLIVGQSMGGQSRILVFAPNQTGVEDVSMVLERIFRICPPGEDCTHRHGTPRDIAVDAWGRLIVAESMSYETQFPELWRVVIVLAADERTNTISFFFPNGTFAGRMGREGSEPGEFSSLGRMMVTGKGSIVLADWGKKAIQGIVVDLSSLHPVAVVRECARLLGLFLLAIVPARRLLRPSR